MDNNMPDQSRHDATDLFIRYEYNAYRQRSQRVRERLMDDLGELGEHTPEIINLLNPSFCALILYSGILEYQEKAKSGISFPLIYLMLPIILHKSTRTRISSRTNMVIWLQRNPDAMIGFPERARSLASFASEAIEFLLCQQIISIEGECLIIKKPILKSKMDRYVATESEIADCVNKAAHLGRWFYSMRSDESIYAVWGVSP